MEIVVNDNELLRIDKYLGLKTEFSRNKIQKLIKDEKILVNKKMVNNNYKVLNGDVITINE